MQFSFPHKCSTRTEAKSRIVNMLTQAAGQLKEHKVKIEKQEWQDYTLNFAFTADGKHFSGTVDIAEKLYDIKVKLPLMLRLFEGKIEKAVKEQVAGMLG